MRSEKTLCALLFCLTLCACASAPPPNERKTGSGGHMLRYSSSQVSVDLTDAQRETLKQLRDRVYAQTPQGRALDAVAAALKQQGFAPVTVDPDTGIVEAERNRVLVPKWQAILRGVLRARIGGLLAKPDHERVAAIVAVRPAEIAATSRRPAAGSLVRVRFDRTVWDSNGDARTETVLQREFYGDFFAVVDKAVEGKLPEAVARSAGEDNDKTAPRLP
jgi:hypothetical protein